MNGQKVFVMVGIVIIVLTGLVWFHSVLIITTP